MPNSPRQVRAVDDAKSPFPADCAERFRAEKMIASGGFGAVWLATQVELDRKVAIKLLHMDALEDREQRERFENEARITATLTSPHIVTLIDHGAATGIPWIAYEYLPGRNLRGRLEAGELPVKEALTAAAQIAEALQVAHDRTILHRDVKPENVLEASPGHYKVTDFGIAKWTSGHQVKTKTGFVLGTPAYLAPELITDSQPSARSDIYALGIMLWEMLVGELPFNDDNPVLLMERHLRSVPRPVSVARPGLPASLDAIVARAIEKNPADRYESASDFAKAVHNAIARLCTPQPGVPLPPEPPPAPRSRPLTRANSPTGRVRVTGSASIVAPVPPAPVGEGRGVKVAALMAAMAVGAAVGWLAKPAPKPVEVAPPSPSPSYATTLEENEDRLNRELKALVEYVNAGPAPFKETPKPGTLYLLHRKYELTTFEATVLAEATLEGWRKWVEHELMLQGQSAHTKQRAYFRHLLEQARVNPAEEQRLRRLRSNVDNAITEGIPILRAMARMPMGIGPLASSVRVMGSLFQQSLAMGSEDESRIAKLMDQFKGEPAGHWPVAYLLAMQNSAMPNTQGSIGRRAQHLWTAVRDMSGAIERNPGQLKNGQDRQALLILARELADVAWRPGVGLDLSQVVVDIEKALRLIRDGGGPTGSDDEFRATEAALKNLRDRIK